MKKKRIANINNLSTEPRFTVGDMVAFLYRSDEIEHHGIVVEAVRSIVKIRPLTDFSTVVLCNVADCRLATKDAE
jgi:hypothetical protein